jgi:hypothetical protein
MELLMGGARPLPPRRGRSCSALGTAARRAATAALAMVLASLPACFHPDQPVCAFSCVTPPQACPPSFTCQLDGFCHSDLNQGLCQLDPVDAGAESATDDSADARPPDDTH